MCNRFILTSYGRYRISSAVSVENWSTSGLGQRENPHFQEMLLPGSASLLAGPSWSLLSGVDCTKSMISSVSE